MEGFFSTKAYWITCKRMTVLVVVGGNGRIVEAAPIVRKFVGQPLENLKRWMRGLGGFRFEELEET